MTYYTTPSGLLVPGNSTGSSCRSNNVAKIGNLAIWAKNGYICMSKELESGEEEFDQTNIPTAEARLKAIAEDTRSMEKMDRPDYARIRVNKQFLEAYAKVIQEAKEQGPFEYADMRRDRVRRRPVSIAVNQNKPS